MILFLWNYHCPKCKKEVPSCEVFCRKHVGCKSTVEWRKSILPMIELQPKEDE